MWGGSICDSLIVQATVPLLFTGWTDKDCCRLGLTKKSMNCVDACPGEARTITKQGCVLYGWCVGGDVAGTV